MLLNNFTLLYVEDDDKTRELVSLLLKDNVKELYTANNGIEGLELYKSKDPDIVITDITMPKMDGLEMSEEIKKIDYFKPIILLTAYSDMDFFKRSVNIGIDKYILKPVTDKDKFFNSLESIAKVLQIEKDKKALEKVVQSQFKISAVGEMISNIAHQWRQPLSIISLNASSIAISQELDNISNVQVTKNIDNIINQTQELSKTIDDFREFFGGVNCIKNEFRLKDTIDKVINTVQDIYLKNSIQISLNVEDLVINQNENQLLQALLNPLNNSKEAFIINNIDPKKRYVLIDLYIKDEDEFIISIKDSAGGICETIIDNLFEPYISTKFESMGTGIGLYMTNQIITKHFLGFVETRNIVLENDDKKLKGTEVLIKLPR